MPLARRSIDVHNTPTYQHVDVTYSVHAVSSFAPYGRFNCAKKRNVTDGSKRSTATTGTLGSVTSPSNKNALLTQESVAVAPLRRYRTWYRRRIASICMPRRSESPSMRKKHIVVVSLRSRQSMQIRLRAILLFRGSAGVILTASCLSAPKGSPQPAYHERKHLFWVLVGAKHPRREKQKQKKGIVHARATEMYMNEGRGGGGQHKREYI